MDKVCEECCGRDFHFLEEEAIYVCMNCGVSSQLTSQHTQTQEFCGGANLKYLSVKGPTLKKHIKNKDVSTRKVYKFSEILTHIMKQQTESICSDADDLIFNAEEFEKTVLFLWCQYLEATGELVKTENSAATSPQNEPSAMSSSAKSKYPFGWGVLVEPEEGREKWAVPVRKPIVKVRRRAIRVNAAVKSKKLQPSLSHLERDMKLWKNENQFTNLLPFQQSDFLMQGGNKSSSPESSILMDFEESVSTSQSDSSDNDIPPLDNSMDPPWDSQTCDDVSLSFQHDNDDVDKSKKSKKPSVAETSLVRSFKELKVNHRKTIFWEARLPGRCQKNYFLEFNLCILYYAILLQRFHSRKLLMFSQLLDLVCDHRVPYFRLDQEMKRDKVFMIRDQRIIHLLTRRTAPQDDIVRSVAKTLYQLLPMDSLPRFPLLSMSRIIVDKLHLPRELNAMLANVIRYWWKCVPLNADYHSSHSFQPKGKHSPKGDLLSRYFYPDCFVIAHVIMLLRLLYHFDGHHEHIIDDTSHKLNVECAANLFIYHDWLLSWKHLLHVSGLNDVKTWNQIDRVTSTQHFLSKITQPDTPQESVLASSRTVNPRLFTRLCPIIDLLKDLPNESISVGHCDTGSLVNFAQKQFLFTYSRPFWDANQSHDSELDFFAEATTYSQNDPTMPAWQLPMHRLPSRSCFIKDPASISSSFHFLLKIASFRFHVCIRNLYDECLLIEKLFLLEKTAAVDFNMFELI